MKENEKMKTDVNSENVNETKINQEIKPKSKKLTIVLVVLILVLVLAIGVCAGMWIAGGTTKVIKNTQTQENQDNVEEVSTDNNETKITEGERKDITVQKDFFSLILPSNWENKYIIDVITGGESDTYMFSTKSDNACLFSIVKADKNFESNKGLDNRPGATLIKQIGNIGYYFITPTDTPSESEEYATLYKDVYSIRDTVVILDNNNESAIVDGTGISTTYYENEYFKLEVPVTWKNRYEVIECNYSNENENVYNIRILQKGKMVDAFSIMISQNENWKDSSWKYMGNNDDGRYVYYMKKFVCRDNDGNEYTDEDYELEKEIDEVKFNVKYEIKNEFGSADKTKMLLGKYFIRGEAGTSQRSYIYYIHENNLYRTSLTDEFPTVILANYADYMYYSEADNKIHVYPLGDSFLNNIAMEDSYVVYENIN